MKNWGGSVEVKALLSMQDAVIQAKHDFAEKMLAASNIKYMMAPHTTVKGFDMRKSGMAGQEQRSVN